MTVTGYLALNSVFVPVWLAETERLRKNNCVKTNKDRHILSAVQISGRDSSFWRYKVCADMRSGSLESLVSLGQFGRSRVNARLALCANISETVRDTSKVTINH